MTGLPWALQALLWLYALVAGGSVLACVTIIFTGTVHGRHRRSRWIWMAQLGAVLARLPRDVADGLANAAEAVLYGRPA